MRIGELSRQTGASRRAIRYYEQTGLLSSERQANGYREFDETAVETVSTIRTLFELGFPSELVARVLPCTGEAGADRRRVRRTDATRHRDPRRDGREGTPT